MTLTRKTTLGILWISLSNVLIKIINFIIILILARLLEPEDFGLFALGTMVVYFFEIFRDLGMGSALIYKTEDIDKAANSAFFLFPSIASAFFFISYITAPFIADFFNEQQLGTIIRVLSLSNVIWSFGSLPSFLLDKNLEFKKQLIRQIFPKIFYGIITIFLAYWGFGVWSLIIGTLIFWLLSVLFTWSLVDWRPSYKFYKKTAFELLDYGKQVAGSNILIYLITIVDVFILGKILNTTYVGYYSIAMGISGLFTTQITNVIQRVMFPVFSIIQGDKITLKRGFMATMKYVSAISIPTSFGIFIMAEDLIKVLFGDKWLPAVAALQILCIYGLNRSLLSTIDQLYLAVGEPEVRTKLNLLQLILMSILIYPLTMRYGIFGTSIAVMLPSALIVVLTFKVAGKIIEENFMYIPRSIMPIFVGSLIMVLSIEILHYTVPIFSPAYELTSSVIIGLFIYVAFLWLTQRELIYEIKELIVTK